MILRGRSPKGDPAADGAEIVLRLAVLLQAGVAPAQAWRHLAAAGDGQADQVCALVARGSSWAAAIAALDEPGGSGGWADVASAWSIATTVGAPLAESLRALASALRERAEAADDVRIALAEPAQTARIMSWLPGVGIVLGLALGFDTIRALLTPVGAVCAVLGIGLTITARRWNGALVRRARAEAVTPGLQAELLAIGLSGGASIARAQELLRASGHEADAATATTLRLSQTAGVPAVELLRASAALERHRARVEGRLRAAALSSRLLLPLGVCILPAFLLLGVAPMLLGVISAMPRIL